MNAPERFEVTTLPDGVEKVSVTSDPRVKHSAIYTFRLEDHTIGNLLRMQILNYPQVTFVGYQMPHPLKNEMILRIQTDGTVSPSDTLLQAFSDLSTLTTSLIQDFETVSGVTRSYATRV